MGHFLVPLTFAWHDIDMAAIAVGFRLAVQMGANTLSSHHFLGFAHEMCVSLHSLQSQFVSNAV